MRVARDLDLEMPPGELWMVLWDVPRMVTCVPGCVDALELEPHRRYRAHMAQRVGPIALAVALEVTISEADPPRHLRLEAKGRDGALGASVALSMSLDLVPREAGSRLRIETQGRILGKLGALGHGVIQRKAEELVQEFGMRLRQAVA